jgi:hypothetical protein
MSKSRRGEAAEQGLLASPLTFTASPELPPRIALLLLLPSSAQISQMQRLEDTSTPVAVRKPSLTLLTPLASLNFFRTHIFLA